ncbi:MAG: SPOR domain-containing protein [Bosea sp. (in: a-proteobacteria)]
MSDQTKTRFAVDLDDLERQLRRTASSQPKAVSSDPLADLARIVGQDDPFKSLFADNRGGSTPPAPVQVAPPVPRRIEPTLDERLNNSNTFASGDTLDADVRKPIPHQDMLDEFDRLLQGELRGTTASSAPTAAPLASDVNSGLEEFREFLKRDDALGHKAENDKTALDLRELDTLSSQIKADEKLPDDVVQPLPPNDYPEPPEEQPADLRSLEPQQPRKGLVIAGMLLGVAALGIGAVVGLRGLSGPVKGTGEAPVIKAEAGPMKIPPQNPGGVEIPNQNKQIYERTPEPKPGEARVVTREEQPIDVQATARAAARVILPGPGAVVPPAGAVADAPAAAPAVVAAVPPPPVVVAPAPAVPAASLVQPSAQAPAQPLAQPPAAALGEPRRVRTIAVRPDGTIAPANGAPAAAAPPAAVPTPRQAVPAVTASTPAPRPAAPRVAVDDAPAPRPAAPRAQIAAATPAPEPRTTESTTGSGFMVQLGAPGSEAEARSTFSSLQRRFADQLSGDSPVIRRADVGNGRTVYRLRVGPFSREDAAEKCQALQAAGGQCFIARN